MAKVFVGTEGGIAQFANLYDKIDSVTELTNEEISNIDGAEFDRAIGKQKITVTGKDSGIYWSFTVRGGSNKYGDMVLNLFDNKEFYYPEAGYYGPIISPQNCTVESDINFTPFNLTQSLRPYRFIITTLDFFIFQIDFSPFAGIKPKIRRLSGVQLENVYVSVTYYRATLNNNRNNFIGVSFSDLGPKYDIRYISELFTSKVGVNPLDDHKSRNLPKIIGKQEIVITLISTGESCSFELDGGTVGSLGIGYPSNMNGLQNYRLTAAPRNCTVTSTKFGTAEFAVNFNMLFTVSFAGYTFTLFYPFLLEDIPKFKQDLGSILGAESLQVKLIYVIFEKI